jgi:fermentation-respiration switch protein FrsA (DUF1100 family)
VEKYRRKAGIEKKISCRSLRHTGAVYKAELGVSPWQLQQWLGHSNLQTTQIYYDVDPTRLVYLGESLGAAVAVGLAVEAPPAALVLRSPFTALAEVGQLHYPWLPVRRLLYDRYPALEQIGQVTAPVLIVAGARDRIVPATMSQRLYEAAAGPKRLVVLPGLDHNDVDLAAGAPFTTEVVHFLAEAATAGVSV